MPEKNILIADDDKSIQKMFVKLLMNEGYRIFLASDGIEAVEVVRNNRIDLAILDIVMPQMDGVEALKGIKEIDKTIEVLMITGHAELDSLSQIIFKYGALDYLLKPFNIVELKLTVQIALRNRDLVLKNSLVKEELENHILELKRDFKEKTFRLRETQIKYRDIVENAIDAIVVAQDEYLKFANRNSAEITGYSKEEMLNTPFTEMIHQDDREMVLNMYRKRLRDEDAPPVYNFRVLRKDGTFFWVESTVVKTVWGERPATLNFMRDISERIKAQETLKIKDAVLARSINGIGLADLEGNVTYVNKAFLKMWGYSDEEEVIGKSIQRFLHKEAEGTEAIKKLRETGSYVDQITAVRKDGALFDARVSSNMITDESNKPVCMMVSFFDVTEQKKAEEFMMRSEKFSLLGQLSAGLAHELRNPLAVISSCSQFCLDNMSLERPVRENFQVIYRNSQRASNLINDLLSFARPDQLKRKAVDINEVLTRMLGMAELEVDPSHVTFVRRLRRGLPKMMGDEEKLGQVFLNLIQNSIQTTSGNGEIVLETGFIAPDNMVEVKVIDNGPGIPEDYRKRIFDPFFTTKDGGTGLGLSICHSIVEQHQGDISVECGEQGGTQVSVRLPVKQEVTEGV